MYPMRMWKPEIFILYLVGDNLMLDLISAFRTK